MTEKYPPLNMPQCQLHTREADGRMEVLDIVRRQYVALTPEEWVRQHVVHTLHGQMHYPLELMQVEGAISLNGLTRRCDIVIYDSHTRPKMIVECKQPQVALSQKVVDQACRYNMVLNVPYLYLTNGLQHLILKVDSENKQLEQLPQMPDWTALQS